MPRTAAASRPTVAKVRTATTTSGSS
uniref:Uncharacterized protein n=1 Tax=Arundo donax TaxID=35708 RepID=A0A0A9B5U4_ARUDO